MDELKKINLDDSVDQYNTQLVEEVVMEPPKSKKIIMPILLIVGIVSGLGTGYILAQKKLLLAANSPESAILTQNPTSAGAVKAGDTFGTADEKTFRDDAEGILQPGGIDGEGSHHIERGDNKSQWVYVTSSVVDLDLFVGHRVMVWGETNSGKKAGWLMDIGKLKVLELQAAQINNIEPAEE